MAFCVIPRDESIFDNKTTDCLNAQISGLDKIIDDYQVDDLFYHKRVLPAPTKSDNLKILDKSFCVEKIFCLRLTIYIENVQYDKEWKKVCTLPVDIPISFVSSFVSDGGYNYYFKIIGRDLFMTGTSKLASTDTGYDKVIINADLPVLNNRLLEKY